MFITLLGLWAISGIIGMSYIRWRDYVEYKMCVTPSDIFATILIGSIVGGIMALAGLLALSSDLAEWLKTKTWTKAFIVWWNAPICKRKDDDDIYDV